MASTKISKTERMESRRFIPYLIPGILGLMLIVIIPATANLGLSLTSWNGSASRPSSA